MNATETDTMPWIEGSISEQEMSASDLISSADDSNWDSSDQETAGWGFGGNSIPKDALAEITSQLAIMTRSGVDVATALGSLARQCKRPALANVLTEVHDSVMAGNPLSNALREHPEVFEATFVATVAAGEASGKMSDVLKQLAAVQRGEIRSRRTLRALMTYPILLFAVSSSVLVALVLFVLPRFSQIFEEYELVLPFVTEVLLMLASELRSRWWLWLPLAGSLLTGMLVWRKTDGGRRSLDLLWLKMPVVSKVYRSQLIGRVCRMFGMMLESGVPLLDVLRLTKVAMQNVHYHELVEEMEEAVLNGRSLGSILETSEIVPESAREMLMTAENTGNLGEVTYLLGAYYEEDTEARMRQVVGLLEPLITIGMGALVAIVVLAVMLPVFDLSTLANR